MAKDILNSEHLQAAAQAAREKNPNKDRIDGLLDQIRKLSDERSALITDEERYYNLLFWMADTEETKALASLMSSQELGRHLINLFHSHLNGSLDEAILDEVLERAGYKYDSEEETESKVKPSPTKSFKSTTKKSTMELTIPTKRLDSKATLPTRAKASDAGADLYALDKAVLEPGQRVLIKTGIAVAIPEGHYGRVAPRSGLALKHGLDVMAGVVDSGYRGDVSVVLINLGQSTYVVNPGDRIAQLIIEHCAPATFLDQDELPESVRSASGFGSSGK